MEGGNQPPDVRSNHFVGIPCPQTRGQPLNTTMSTSQMGLFARYSKLVPCALLT